MKGKSVSWGELLPLFAQTGVFGTLAYFGYRLHLDSVKAHEKRADDWKEAAHIASTRADERDKQLAYLLQAVTNKTASTP